MYDYIWGIWRYAESMGYIGRFWVYWVQGFAKRFQWFILKLCLLRSVGSTGKIGLSLVSTLHREQASSCQDQ